VSRQRFEHGVSVVAFVVSLMFLLAVAGVAVDDFLDRARYDDSAEAIEVDRWECVASFVQSESADGERLRLEIEPAGDTYIRQRVVESVYPMIDVTDAPDSSSIATLRVVVRPGDDPTATCRGLAIEIGRP
jgi:hypothetical protein